VHVAAPVDLTPQRDARILPTVGYPGRATGRRVARGVVHKLGSDLRTALIGNAGPAGGRSASTASAPVSKRRSKALLVAIRSRQGSRSPRPCRRCQGEERLAVVSDYATRCWLSFNARRVRPVY
jgi:hypothetical protein